MNLHRRAGGVNQRHAAVQRPVQQLFRVGEVIVEHVPAVLLGRIGAGPLVQYSSRLHSGGAAADEIAKLGAVHVVGDRTIAQVAELVPLGQVVNGQDVPDPALVERADHVASDESSSSRNDIHDQNILE